VLVVFHQHFSCDIKFVPWTKKYYFSVFLVMKEWWTAKKTKNDLFICLSRGVPSPKMTSAMIVFGHAEVFHNQKSSQCIIFVRGEVI